MVVEIVPQLGSASKVLAEAARVASATVACVVGKGPTVDRFRSRRPESLVLAINQAVGVVGEEADFAVVTDYDVLTDEYLTRLPVTCRLVLPYYPHVNCRPNRHVPITTAIDMSPALRRLAGDRRLLAYRSDRWPSQWPGPVGPDWPRLRVRAFTAVACVALAVTAGLKRIQTAGVDGGKDYHPVFQAEGLTPLSNGQKSFDAQFREFDRYRRRGVRIEHL